MWRWAYEVKGSKEKSILKLIPKKLISLEYGDHYIKQWLISNEIMDTRVVVSSSHQSPCWSVSRFRSAQSIAILLSVWSASKGIRKGGGCHEATDHSRCNGCALSDLYIHVLTKDSAVTDAQLCQYSSCLPWRCLFGCCNGRRSAIKQFWWTAFNGSSDRILVDAADCRLVAGVAEWLFGMVLLDARLKPADQISSSFRPIIWRSVAELMAGMLW